MGTEITVVERLVQPLVPRFDAVLKGSIMDGKALVASLLMSVEKTPRIAECTPQSLVNSVNSAAILHLPIDGASGQFFLLPFGDRKNNRTVAQPCVGYKGFNTIGARGGVSINADIVREGDAFEYQLGSGGFVRHKPQLDNPGRIIAAWAVGTSREREPIIAIMGIGELNETMKRSPAMRGNASDSPWHDEKVGRPAMFSKTARRRLARSMPFEIDRGRYLLAARMDEAFDEQGKLSYLKRDEATGQGTVVVDGEFTEGPIAPRESQGTPKAEDLLGPKVDPEFEGLRLDGLEAAERGTVALRVWWGQLTRRQQLLMEKEKDEKFKAVAETADNEAI